MGYSLACPILTSHHCTDMVMTIYIDHVVEKTVYYARSQTHISSVNINYSKARVGLMYEVVYVPITNNHGTGTISNNLGGSPLCL